MDIKKFGIGAGVAVALVVGGFAAGRYAAPDKVVTVDRVVTVHDVQVVKVVDTEKVLAALQNISQQKDVHKTKTTVKQPDGTVTTTVTTDDKTKTDSQTKIDQTDKTKSTETKKETEVVIHETIKTVERARPQYSLSLQPGFDVAGALGSGSAYSLIPSDSLLLRHLVIGASVERRLIGPLYAGVWGNTAGMGGLIVRLEF